MVIGIRFLVPFMIVLCLLGEYTSPQHPEKNTGVASNTSQNSEGMIKRLDQDVIGRIDQINLKLRNASSGKIAGNETKMARFEAQAFELAKELWSILDEQVVLYLDRNDLSSVDKINGELGALLHTTPTVDEGGWSVRIELYSSGIPNLYLAKYGNWFRPGNFISTLRVLHRVDSHWQVVGRMEETALAKTLEPQHREELKQLVKEREPLLDAPNIWVDRAIGVAGKSIQMNGMSISTRSIQPLSSGGIRFASIHTTLGVGNITVHTLIEWEWTPTKGLEAVAWVWGDQWTYDEQAKDEVARWESLDPNKKGIPVKLKDFLGH